MTAERFWIICSAALLIVAAILFWRNNLSAAFVIAALGACAWFLSYRAQLRQLIPDDPEREESSDELEISDGSNSPEVSGSDQGRAGRPGTPRSWHRD